METVSLKMEKNFLHAIERIMLRHNYMTKTEFIRESIRDKIRIIYSINDKSHALIIEAVGTHKIY